MVSIRTLSATLAILAVSGGVAAAQSPVTDLNMRSGPGTGYQVLGVIPAGAPVAVLGCDGSWCQVNYAGRIGYANGSYLGGDTRTAIGRGAAVAYASAGGYGAMRRPTAMDTATAVVRLATAIVADMPATAVMALATAAATAPMLPSMGRA